MSEERNELNELNTTQTNHEYGGSEIQVLDVYKRQPDRYVSDPKDDQPLSGRDRPGVQRPGSQYSHPLRPSNRGVHQKRLGKGGDRQGHHCQHQQPVRIKKREDRPIGDLEKIREPISYPPFFVDYLLTNVDNFFSVEKSFSLSTSPVEAIFLLPQKMCIRDRSEAVPPRSPPTAERRHIQGPPPTASTWHSGRRHSSGLPLPADRFSDPPR